MHLFQLAGDWEFLIGWSPHLECELIDWLAGHFKNLSCSVFSGRGTLKKTMWWKVWGVGTGLTALPTSQSPPPCRPPLCGDLRVHYGCWGEGRGGEAQTLRPLVLILKVLVALVTNWWVLQDYCLLRLNNGQCGEQYIWCTWMDEGNKYGKLRKLDLIRPRSIILCLL